MRWDDLQLLHLIDELEANQELTSLSNGLRLMERAAGDEQIDWDRDTSPFVHELLLAKDAGYLTWRDQTGINVVPTNPRGNPHYWLQEIWDLRLTLAGRDRARGRVVTAPLPDPDEDDGRPIAGMTLEEIARIIGDTYSGSQLPTYLRDSGIPVETVPAVLEGTKWVFVRDVLEGLQDGGSTDRRVLREFIGAWLEGKHHVAPSPEVRKEVTAHLGNQGWHVRDGRLVIGERSSSSVEPLIPLGADARIGALHVEVRLVADRYLEGRHPEVAVFEAFKAVNNRVKEMTGLDLDGSPLMGQAFAESNPLITLEDLSTETGRNIQAGFRFLFMGAVRAIRNPDAHEQFRDVEEESALELLAFASLLMRRLDTVVIGRADAPSHPGPIKVREPQRPNG